MSITIDIRVKKANKIYYEGDTITGTIAINSPTEFKHDGIVLTMEGLVSLQLSPKNVGIFEAFYNSVKPVQLCHSITEVSGPGKLPAGKTDIPFELPLFPRPNRTIYETYHGVFINIQYTLKCDLKRGFLTKDIIKVAEFIVEYKPTKCEIAVTKPVNFVITPESLEGGSDLGTIPRFKICGTIDSTVCCIAKPFSGKIVIENTEIPIKSIELQLVRVETCGCAEGYARDVTEIQNIQIGEGNVACGIDIPIHMIFPRLFTCPTLLTTNFKVEPLYLKMIRMFNGIKLFCKELWRILCTFRADRMNEYIKVKQVGRNNHQNATKISILEEKLKRSEQKLLNGGYKWHEFEVNVVIIFENDHLVSENFPIILTRA